LVTSLDPLRIEGDPYTRWQPWGHDLPKPAKHVLFSKKETGARVRAARDARGVTQVELAKSLGIPQSNISELERGGRGLTVHQAVKIAKALRITVDELLVGGNGAQEKKPLRSVKVLRRLQRIERLPEAKQRAVLKVLDALLEQQAG
jgi:transcriptional regulator with XRE-family HTH domain